MMLNQVARSSHRAASHFSSGFRYCVKETGHYLGRNYGTMPRMNQRWYSSGKQNDYENLTHVDDTGRAKMVNVGHKLPTERQAVAVGTVRVGEKVTRLIQDNNMKKGDVLSIAELAGIMGAKQTSLLIPLCHPIALTHIQVSVELVPQDCSVQVQAEACTTGSTGVEMEALTAVSIASLTVYDMCKAVTHNITITDIHLLSKSGGKKTYNKQ